MTPPTASPATDDGVPHEISLMGAARVDGRPARHVKPLELALALHLGGGRMTKAALVEHLYGGVSCDSAIPTLCYRAKKLGIAVAYDAECSVYRLHTPVTIDACTVMSLLESGRVEEAMALWATPVLPTSSSPLAEALRSRLDAALAEAALAATDPAVAARAAGLVDDPALRTQLLGRTPTLKTAVLADSILKGTAA